MHDLELFSREYQDILIEHHKRVGETSMSLNHYHDSYEIYYLISGKRYYFIKDKTYLVEKGNIVLINAFDLHKTTHAGSYSHERILVNFKKDFVKDIKVHDIDVLGMFTRDINVINIQEEDRKYVESILYKIIEESKKELPGFISVLNITLVDLLIFLSRYIAKTDIESSLYYDPSFEKILEIVKYINHNYNKKLSLKLISQKFYISPYHLSRTFKKATGFTFVEYINSVRIKEAQKLLKESNLNVSTVGDRVGFGSSTHFGRVFKSLTGFSPLRYKKMNII